MTTVTARVKPRVRWGLEHGVPRQVLKVAARRGDLQAELIERAGGSSTPQLADFFDRVRGEGPLARTRFAYLSVDHAVIREALSSTSVRAGFPAPDSAALARVLRWSEGEALHPVKPPSLLAVDGPAHARYRRLVTRVFTARAVEALRPRVEELAHQLLDELDTSDSGIDLVAEYCSRLPVQVISEILGVQPEHHERVLRFGERAAPSLEMAVDWTTYRDVDRNLHEFDRWLGAHLESLRRSPGENLMSRLVAEADEKGTLSERELKSTAGLVLAAGFETTVNLLSNGVALLVSHRDQLEGLGAERVRWEGAVEEILRCDPPVMVTARTVASQMSLAGRELAPGSVLSLVIAGANRDPEIFADPHRFDTSRDNAREHLAFGAGRHYCLGASLARLEGEIGLRVLFERFPQLSMIEGTSRRRGTRVLRGFERLPVRLR